MKTFNEVNVSFNLQEYAVYLMRLVLHPNHPNMLCVNWGVLGVVANKLKTSPLNSETTPLSHNLNR